MSKVDHAHELARQGFHVFPLVPNGKRPLSEQSWKTLATQDPATIRQIWHLNPDANIAIRTDGYVAFDLDQRRGGGDTWAEIVDKAEFLGEEIRHTRRHQTWSGGSHVIFRQPPGMHINCSTDKVGPGVDVKADGGYLVAPGSTIDGKEYSSVNPSRPIAELPDWLLSLCTQARPRSAAAGIRLVEEDDIAIARAHTWLANAPDAVEGSRDDTGYKIAAKLYNFGVSRDTCRELLADWSYTHCFPPLEPEDIERLSRSAEVNRSQPIGIEHPAAPAFEPVEIKPRQPAAGSTTERPRLHYLRFSESVERALTHAAEPLIDGLLDCGTMSVVYGESNSGKSFAVLDLSYHIAAGRPWCGKPVRQGAVLYVAAEGGGGIHKRDAALAKRYGEVDVPLYIVPCPVNLLRSDADLVPLIELCKQVAEDAKVDLVAIVVDTLSRAISGGDENSSVDMGAFVRNCDRLRAETKGHICVIHHSGKDRARGARGHSLLRAATDTEIEVVDNTIAATKQRDLDGAFKLRFSLKPTSVGVDQRGKVVSSCTVEFQSGTGDGEPLPLTPEMTEILEALEALIHDEAEAAGVGITEYPINWQHMQKVLEDRQRYPDGENLPRGNGVSRQLCQKKLLHLTQTCHARKGERGQWFMKFATNATDLPQGVWHNCNGATTL
jgi:hypothetical protein